MYGTVGRLAIGNEHANIMRGTNSDGDILRGLLGNDQINGGGGADSLFGDEGDDLLHYEASAVTIDGGTGEDTLYLVVKGASSVTLDLTSVVDTIIKDIETVRFASSTDPDAVNQSHKLIVNATDVLALSSTTDVLKIFGESDDTVHLTGGGWTKESIPSLLGFEDYTNGAATVKIDTHILESHIILT